MYDNAKKALRIFYDKAKSKLPFENFNDFIEYYRTDFDVLDLQGNPLKHDDFLSGFDKAVGYVDGWQDVINGMRKLADSLPKGKVPNRLTFYDALSEQVESFSFTDAKIVFEKTVDDISKAAIGGVGLWLLQTVAAFYLVKMLSKE